MDISVSYRYSNAIATCCASCKSARPSADNPEWAATILRALPFRSIVYSPVSIYVGSVEGMEIVYELGLQFGWLAALIVLQRVYWGRCRRKLFVFGG